MKSITESVSLQAPADVVWRTVQQPELFVHVAGSWIRFPAAEGRNRPWQAGDRVFGWIFLFRFIPLSKHTIEVISIDDNTMTFISNEGGGFVKTWNHYIYVEDIDGSTCRYTDRVDIDAGLLTPVIVALSKRFYRYRQRRWQALAKLLAASTERASAGSR